MLFLFNCLTTINAQQKQEEINTQTTLQQKNSSSSEVSNRNSSSSSSNSSGGLVDAVLPASSPFQLTKNIEGTIQNSINKSSGKVLFSLPISSVTANTISYNVSLTYNGTSAFETAKKTNKFRPTGVLGVGFNFSFPKIIADYKNTAAKDDDTYYFVDGNNSKLICTNKTDTYLEFKSEKYAPWIIKYIKGHKNLIEIRPGHWVENFIEEDYWEITKEDGTIYQFGKENEGLSIGTGSKVLLSTWGNWIGDSNQNPKGRITTEWNIYRIKDQWNNNITFLYEKVSGKQNTAQQFGNIHTEAIYLKEIKSSDNSKIVFNYENKIPQEYFEPHTEQSEPDAFQERYEKKFLQNIQTFNSNNELIFKYKLEYSLIDHTNPIQLYRGKRYLTKIIQENKNGESLPPQKFQYHTSGIFKGGIREIIYPTGGSVTYNYKKKTLFTNTPNRFSGSQPNVSNYYLTASYNAGNYVLDLYRSKNPVNGSLYRYKIVRYHWTGIDWIRNEYTIPNLLPYVTYVDEGSRSDVPRYLDGLKVIHRANYYGLMYFNRKNNSANLYLFHLKNDGKTWKTYSQSISSVESKDKAPYTEDPDLLNGENFVAIGTKSTGELRVYTWNGISWNYDYIFEENEPAKQYYYSARNNFILSLNIARTKFNGGTADYSDRFNIHFLDNEKKWQTKSWTEITLPKIKNITSAGYFYPNNSMSGFMAGQNPEYFLRWDKNYNLLNIDDVLGGHKDNIPLQALSNNLFSLGYLPNSSLIRTARFNGNNWNVLDHGYYQGVRKNSAALGDDAIFYEKSRDNKLWYLMYNANGNNWIENNLTNGGSNTSNFLRGTQIFENFLLANNSIYEKHEHPFASVLLSPYTLIEQVPFNVELSTTNGLNYVYASSINAFQHHNPNYISSVNTKLYYPNKYNNKISNIDFNGKFGVKGMQVFGGYQQFLSGNSIYLRNKGNGGLFSTYLYKIIDDNVNQNIEDVVVDYIQIDNKLNSIRKINYEFDQYTFLPNESIYYGKATTEHKGYGNANNGKVINYFNRGLLDLRFLGLPVKTEIRDASNSLKSETVYDNNLFPKNYYNSYNTLVGQGFFIRITKKTKNLIQDNGTLTSSEEYEYNDIGLLHKKKTINNNENTIETNTTYAYELFSFLNTKNILNKPTKLVQKSGNHIVGTSETRWKIENGKMFPYKTLAGISSTKVLTEITRINNLGLAEEDSNGKGVFNVNLLGYNNKYSVARINNANFNEVISNLDVSYETLQSLNTASLKIELLKLYDKLPKASLTLSFYDNNGNLISNIDARKEEINHVYDDYNRLIYTTDSQGNKLTETEYNFKQ